MAINRERQAQGEAIRRYRTCPRPVADVALAELDAAKIADQSVAARTSAVE